MMEITELITRIVIAFLVLFITTRIIGRKEISQMTFFNFVSAIAIGSITANLAVNSQLSITHGLIAIVGWGILTFLIASIDLKSKNARRITSGEPIIVIKEGKIMEQALRSTRLNIDTLSSMLRQQSIFSIQEVEYAIFETSGKLSVMKKENVQTVTKMDLNIPAQNKVYPIATQVVSDSMVVSNNLARLNLDQSWLEQQLKNQGVSSISEVFFAEVQPDGSLHIDKKQDNLLT